MFLKRVSLRTEGTPPPSLSAIIQPVLKVKAVQNGPPSKAIPIIDLQKKSKFGSLLESLRVRSENVPRFSRMNNYQVRHKYMDVLPVEKRLVLK